MSTFEEIREKLKANPEDGRVYAELGDFYYLGNVNQAYICYEHAYHRSDGSLKDELEIKMETCKKSDYYKVVPTAFVILSYNSKAIMEECLNAIHNTCDNGSYEVIVVDNMSTDGVREWLIEQNDIKLVLNDKNSGFAAGCNQGAKLADSSYDIMLLNNDAIVTPHAVFLMRVGLYAKDRIGAVGPVSNHAILEQRYDSIERSKEEWMKLATDINLPSEYYEQVLHWLQGHALLIKRTAWDDIGGVDTNFGFGGYEDNEYCIRMNANGYLTVNCRNTFVYHYGSVSMKTKPVEYQASMQKNLIYLNKKWGLDWAQQGVSRFELVNRIKASKTDTIKILEINGGFCSELNILKYRYPNADVFAIEKDETVARIASNYLKIICGDIETMNIPFEAKFFDYIIMYNVVEHLLNPQRTLEKIRPYLKTEGSLLISAANASHISVIKELVKGNFSNTKETFPGQRKKHLYTTSDLTDLVNKSGYIVNVWIFLYNMPVRILDEEEKELLDVLLKISWVQSRNSYVYDRCLIEARPR